MKVKIENIGPIKECQMELEDLAVIVGKNSSGKSTIGKALYTLLHSISPSNLRNFESEQQFFLKSKVKNIMYDLQIFNMSEVYYEELFELDKIMRIEMTEELYEEKINEIKNRIIDIINKTQDLKNIKKLSPRQEESKREILRNFQILKEFKKMEFESDGAKKRIFNRIKNAEFRKFLRDENITGKIEFDKINFEINADKISTNYEKNISNMINNAIIIDTPMILKFSDIYINKSRYSSEDYSYHSYLIDLLYKKQKPMGLFDDIDDKEIIKLEEEIKKTIHGNIYFDESEVLKFKDSNNEEFEINDIATGIKTFGILLLLLRKLDKQTLLILDEPEVHLHPEWQLILAEIVTLISKRLNIKIIVTTHSNFFLEAIELYSKKYKIGAKYYFCEDGEVSEVKKENLRDMYRKINGNIYDKLDKLSDEVEVEEVIQEGDK